MRVHNRLLGTSLLAAMLVAAAGGCAADAESVEESTSSLESDIEAERSLAPELPGSTLLSALIGKVLFFRAEFRGNDRTCGTCHGRQSGTISPRDVEARFRANPRDALFRSIDSDDGVSSSYTRLRSRATIRVRIPLPPNVTIAEEPEARDVVLNRGVPTMFNTPALDPFLMVDGRETSVEAQALGAVKAHFEPGVLPTGGLLRNIADFERQLFTSHALRRFAAGGPPPALPPGRTALEKQGRTFFVAPQPGPPASKLGMCGSCHSGPMLDTPTPGAGPPTRFSTVLVSEVNRAGNPVRTFVFKNPDGTETKVPSPDPGRALVSGSALDANTFRVPTLWGIGKTAPYFHDNSAASLEELMDQYVFAFDVASKVFGVDLRITPEDRAAMLAYMRLL